MVNDLLDIIYKEAEALKSMTPGTKEYSTLSNEYNKHVELYNKNVEATAKQQQTANQYTVDMQRIEVDKNNSMLTDKLERSKIKKDIALFTGGTAMGVILHFAEQKAIFSGTALKKFQNFVLSKIR